MNGLLRLALTATGTGALVETARVKSRRIVVAAVCGWIAATFVIAALLWFDIALFLYCEPRLGAWIAALVSGGALIVVALLAMLPMAMQSRPARTPPPQPIASPAFPANELAAKAVREANNLFREHKGTIIVAAALAGLLLSTRNTRD
jgi:hypothetical protein